MDFRTLRDARPGLFDTVANDIRRWAQALEDHGNRFRGEVVHRTADPAVWDGAAAQAAATHIDDVRRTVFHASDELFDLDRPLRDLSETVRMKQGELLGWIGNAQAQGFVVADDGSFHRPPGEQLTPDQADALTAAADTLVAERDDILRAAARIDEEVAGRLAALAGETLDTATVGAEDRELEADAERAARLASSNVPGALDQLGELLDEHGEDETFATTFHRELGAEGVIDLSARLTIPADLSGPERQQQMADLQALVGVSLATATDPMNSDHLGQGYIDELNEQGRQRHDVAQSTNAADPNRPISEVRPYGYQLLGPILQSGGYSTEFLVGDPGRQPPLVGLGEGLLAFERENPGVWEETRGAGLADALDLAGDPALGDAIDPFEGFNAALGRNPEAAQTFFDHPDDPGRIRYFLDERPRPELSEDDFHHGADQLGNALDAATQFEPDGARAARIAERIVNTLGAEAPSSNPTPSRDDFNIAPEMRDSIGNILGRNIDHVNSAFTDIGLLPDEPHFEPAALNRVLQEVAYDPDAYANLYTLERAEIAYTFNSTAADGTPAGLEVLASSRAHVLAALDRGMAFATTSDQLANDGEYNAAVERIGRISNFALGGGVFASGINPFVGAGANFAGGELISQIVEDARIDTSPAANTANAETYFNSRTALHQLALQGLWDNGHIQFDPAHPQLFRETAAGDFEPIPLGEMSTEQLTEFREYARSDGTYLERIGQYVNDIAQSYNDGLATANQVRGMS